ncbi:MAG: hypothetical protein COU65_04010 [Candidatus Pacebacteria bacterium CG10_big_fil_rev_8_21_14_0_10_42_12]|nr:hypothetical protein [Candidatus Paceibacterota bacterium]PIR62337.1 MAG: hypothetical protein COU65_04010 [Candidatus Pacebacteria bacterium CG10_big_fil_rev_8_21_14_0_10_42_12]
MGRSENRAQIAANYFEPRFGRAALATLDALSRDPGNKVLQQQAIRILDAPNKRYKFSEKEKAKRLALNNKVREKLKGKDI